MTPGVWALGRTVLILAEGVSWVGCVPEQVANVYFLETFAEERDNTPLSAFARDQGVTWYDYDFPEYGWGTASTIHELVASYSYSDQDEVEKPQSVDGDGYWLRYMGTIEYPI